jgi:hypothetical protein
MDMKRCVWVLAFAFGCGGGGGGSGGHMIMNSPYPNCPDCMHAQYVVGPKTNTATDHGVTVPQSNAQAMMLGCDINNDGEIDNQLGKVLGALKAASMNVDVQASVDKSFTTGGINVLFDIEYKPSITDTMVSGVKGYIGMHDTTDGKTCDGTNPCAFYQGGGKFTVTNAVGAGFGGQVKGGAGAYGPGELTIQFPLVMDQPPLNAHLIAASLTGTIAMDSISNGKICGAIPADELKTTILPQVATLLSAQVKKGGSTGDTIKSLFDADHSCDTDPACTPTAPATPACNCITEMEVENNSIIKSLLSPDLDLDPNKNNPFVTDPTDPTFHNDALSLGLGFEANSAIFPAQ